jgi:ATP-dependent DNA helicase RecG
MRPEILFPLFAPSASLKGVGPKLAPLVEKAAGPLVRDLLFTAPTAVVERPRRTTAALVEGQVATSGGDGRRARRRGARSGGSGASAPSDEHGFLSALWFKGFSRILSGPHPRAARRNRQQAKVDRWRDGRKLHERCIRTM